MPLSKENRKLFEVAMITYLRRVGEATSKDIYYELKQRGFLAVRSPKQVSMICLGFERKGVLLSRVVKVSEKLKIYKKKSWRLNPNFYEEHPRQSMFSLPITARELEEIRKKRMKAT